MRLGQEIPNFDAMTTHGMMQFHDYIKNTWCVLFSHPKDFTPVCTTELGAVEHLLPEFKKRGVIVIGLSVDSIRSHEEWSVDIAQTQGAAPSFPIIGYTSLKVSKLLDTGAGRRAPQAAGTLFKPRIGHGLQLFQAVKGLLARINRLTKVTHMSLDFTLSLRMPRLAGVDMEVQLRCKAPIRLVDDAPGTSPLGDRRLHVVDAQNRD